MEEETPKHNSTLFSFNFLPKRKTPPSTGSPTDSDSTPKSHQQKKPRPDNLSPLRQNLERVMDEGNADLDLLLRKFDERFESFKGDIMNLMVESLKDLNEKVVKLETRVEECERSVQEVKTNVVPSEIHADIKQIKIELNRQAQYSRKDNIRIFGLKESQSEDLSKEVCKLADSIGVKVNTTDIHAVHRLPSKFPDKPKPVIVRFKNRNTKQDIMKVRKRLKSTGTSIADDLTIDNVRLMNRAESSELFQSVWFSNGKVRAKDKKGKIHILELFKEFNKL